MKSLKVKKIDDLDVVVGFQDRVICPVSTQSKNKQAVYESAEFKELGVLNKKQDDYMSQSVAAGKQSLAMLKAAKAENLDPKLVESYTRSAQKLAVIKDNLTGMLGTLNEEAKALVLACRKKEIEILTDNPVYNDEVVDPASGKQAGPRQGEVIKSSVEIDDLKQKFDSLANDKKLCSDGSLVTDLRGKCFCKKVGGKWQKTEIDRLGVEAPVKTKLKEDLTELELGELAEQEEIERISALSPKQKTAEFQNKKTGLAGQAQSMETELKFDGDVEYIDKAQEFYDFELVELKIKYGVK